MSPEQKEKFIKEELYHELCCLLEAAAFWRVLKDSGIAGCEISIAMDSAFVHARNLFIFFASTKRDEENRNNIKMTDLGVKRLYKELAYSQSKDAINRHVFHLNKKRLDPINVKGSGPINDKVEVFADKILKLWEKFEKEEALGDELRSVAQKARIRAIKDARNTADSKLAAILSAAQGSQIQPSVLQVDESQFVS